MIDDFISAMGQKMPFVIRRQMKNIKDGLRKEIALRKYYYVKYPPKIPYKLVDTRTLISNEYRYCYFRIPKAANSTVTSSLMINQGYDDIKRGDLEAFKVSGQRMSRIKASDCIKVLDRYFKFTVVRSPYSRTVSAFLDKIVRGNYDIKIVKEMIGCKATEKVSFQHFLSFLETPGALSTDAHWARQIDLINLPLKNVDMIGKCENLDSDLPVIMKNIFGESSKIMSYAPHKTESHRVLSGLTSKDKKRIYRIYEYDFDAFKYVQDI